MNFTDLELRLIREGLEVLDLCDYDDKEIEIIKSLLSRLDNI